MCYIYIYIVSVWVDLPTAVVSGSKRNQPLGSEISEKCNQRRAGAYCEAR